MIMRLRVGDRETDRDHVQEGRLSGFCPLGAKVSADMKDKLESRNARLAGRKQRRIGAAVSVGVDRLEQSPRARRRNLEQFDRDARSRSAAHGVENMGRKPGHEYRLLQRCASNIGHRDAQSESARKSDWTLSSATRESRSRFRNAEISERPFF